MRTRSLLWLLLFSPGMAPQTAPAQAPLPVEVRQRLGVLIVVDGSGDDTTVAENMTGILCARGVPFGVHAIRWCRWSLPARDHKDYDAQIKGARRLANYVANYREVFPQEKICLLGYSSGTHVILAAAGMLPPRSVDRIVLMASTVSYTYDLRPGLLCSRGGVDAFFSSEDHLIVLAAENCGTADGRSNIQTAGEVGFAVPRPGHPDACLYDHLRQYRWNRSVAWTGHRGGHLGFTRATFLEAYILPLLLAPVPNDK